MHAAHRGSPGKQIDSASTQLARARSGEYKSWCAWLLQHVMYHVQQLGRSLHFVNHYVSPISIASDQLTQSLWACRQLAEGLRLRLPAAVKIYLTSP